METFELPGICWMLSIFGKCEEKNQCEEKQSIGAGKNRSNFPFLCVKQEFQSRNKLKMSEIESQRMGKMKNHQKRRESKAERPTPSFTH